MTELCWSAMVDVEVFSWESHTVSIACRPGVQDNLKSASALVKGYVAITPNDWRPKNSVLTPSSRDIWTCTLGPLKWWRFPQSLVLFWNTFSSYAAMPTWSIRCSAGQHPDIDHWMLWPQRTQGRFQQKPRSHTKWIPQRFHKSQAHFDLRHALCNWTQNISTFSGHPGFLMNEQTLL